MNFNIFVLNEQYQSALTGTVVRAGSRVRRHINPSSNVHFDDILRPIPSVLPRGFLPSKEGHLSFLYHKQEFFPLRHDFEIKRVPAPKTLETWEGWQCSRRTNDSMMADATNPCRPKPSAPLPEWGQDDCPQHMKVTDDNGLAWTSVGHAFALSQEPTPWTISRLFAVPIVGEEWMPGPNSVPKRQYPHHQCCALSLLFATIKLKPQLPKFVIAEMLGHLACCMSLVKTKRVKKTTTMSPVFSK